MSFEFLPVTAEDFPKLIEWMHTDIDETHHAMVPEFWITGNGYVSFQIADNEGTCFYTRFDKEQDGLRMHTQFAPESTVSKQRNVDAILATLPTFIEKVRKDFQFIVFETTFPKLAFFMQVALGFRLVEGSNDYRLSLVKKPQAVVVGE